MSAETEPSRLTLDEIALMRAIVTWRRELVGFGWPRAEFHRRRSTYRPNSYSQWDVQGKLDDRYVAVEFPLVDDPADGYAHIVYSRPGRPTQTRSFDAMTVMQAVDMLVALDILPARFSTAYRAGWDKAPRFPGEVDEQHVPAVPAAW